MNDPSDPRGGALPPEASSLWDAWCEARSKDRALTPQEFAARRGMPLETVLAELQLMLELEHQSPPSPLVDAVPIDVTASAVRFAGFVLLETLGQGSSGVVYLARDEREGGAARKVALKVLNPLLAASPDRRDSILHEAEVARSLDHEGIVRVLASGVERGYAWIATEFADGETLDRRIGQDNSAARREALALDVGLQLSSALAHAHARKVIHRDLKPSNLILSADDRLRVLDFGLARTQGTAFSMSRTGEMVGTPLYMSPEQARGESGIGPWTDVYAVGLMLWEIASGERLDEEEPLHALLARIARGQFRIRSREMRSITPGLRAVIQRCIEPHPEDRYRRCEALRSDLEDVRAARRPGMGALSTPRRWLRARSRNPVSTVASLVGLALIGGSASWLWWHWPVPVELTTIEDGKQLWIDGEQRETSTARVTLWPGLHDWKAQFMELPDVFEGKFPVSPGTPLHLLKLISPWHGPDVSLKLDAPIAAGAFAWVVIATPLEAIDLAIDGRDMGTVAGIAGFRLPLGKHKLNVAAPGLSPWSRDIDLATQDLCFLPFEMEPQGSAWERIVLYSAFDDAMQTNLREERNVRKYAEKEQLTAESADFVRKVYWGPDRDFEEGTVLMAIPLPENVEDIEVELADWPQFTTEHVWTTVSMGVDANQMHPILEFDPAHGKGPVAATREAFPGIAFISPSPGMLQPVRAAIRGQRTVYMRWSIGGVTVGNDIAHAYAMRTNALPYRHADGRMFWHPAVRIRVKHGG